MSGTRMGWAEAWWWYALAGGLMTGGPVWQYLYTNRYPFDRLEATVLPLAAALLGAGLAVLGNRIGGWVESLAFGLLAVIFVDLQFDLTRPTALLAAAGVAVAFSLVFRSRRAVLACLMLGAFDLSSLPRARVASTISPAAPVERPVRTNPLLVHIVLDEQWGIGGLRAAGDSVTAAFLTDFYASRGFEVYQSAYSRWHNTRHSIPELMSLGQPPEVVEFEGFRFRLLANPYFERLAARGYAIHVFQSAHLDFCHSARVTVSRCEEIPVVTIANIGYLDGPWITRGVLTGWQLLANTSYLYALLPSRLDGSVLRRSYIGRGLDQIGRIRQAVATELAGGDALVVHLLMPHRPLEVDAECRMYTDPGKRMNYLPRHMNPETWRRVLAAYGAQVRCTHRALAGLIAAIDTAVGRGRAIIIVHGDHGSRMSPENPRSGSISGFDPQQLNGEFSTLLAVRRPHIPPAVYSAPIPIQDFFWDLATSDFTGTKHQGWPDFVRDRKDDPAHPEKVYTDTLRVLARDEMLWAWSPRIQTSLRGPATVRPPGGVGTTRKTGRPAVSFQFDYVTPGGSRVDPMVPTSPTDH